MQRTVIEQRGRIFTASVGSTAPGLEDEMFGPEWAEVLAVPADDDPVDLDEA